MRMPTTVILREQQSDPDPLEEHRTDDLQVGDRKHVEREKDQNNSHEDRAKRSPHDPLDALVIRQAATGQSDHNGVVATQQDVNHDDLANREPEGRKQQLFRQGVPPTACKSGLLSHKYHNPAMNSTRQVSRF